LPAVGLRICNGSRKPRRRESWDDDLCLREVVFIDLLVKFPRVLNTLQQKGYNKRRNTLPDLIKFIVDRAVVYLTVYQRQIGLVLLIGTHLVLV